MTLKAIRIENFDELWCLGASGGLEFCVSSTSFQKSKIGWPHQPPTEKLLKFKLIFHDSTKKLLLSKHQNKLNSRTWMTLKVIKVKVIFKLLETSTASLTSSASATSWPQQPLQPYFLKNFPHPDDWIIPGTKMTNMSPFLCKE
jgi:hypothetical protein